MEDLERLISEARQQAADTLARHQGLARRAFALRRELADVERELRGAEFAHRSAIMRLRELSHQLAGRAMGRRFR